MTSTPTANAASATGGCPFASTWTPVDSDAAQPQTDWSRLAGSPPSWNSAINPVVPGARPGVPTLLVSRHEDVVRVVMDPTVFHTPESINPRLPQVPEAYADRLPQGWPWEGSMLFGTEPWQKSTVRRLTSQVLNGDTLDARLPRIRQSADALFERAARIGRFDVIGDFSHPYVLRMLAEDVLGLGDAGVEMAELFTRESQELFLAALGLRPLDDDAVLEIAEHQATFRAYLLDVIEHRAAEPAGDLISEVLSLTHADGEPIRHVDVIKAAQHVLLAFDQPVLMIGNIVHFLLRDPTRYQALVEDPARIPAAMEECMRLLNTLPILQTRVANEDTHIGEVAVPAGTVIALHTGAANRDGDVFADPDAYRPGRGDARASLTFSRGGHFCAGSRLARQETQIALESLVRHFPRLALTETNPPRTSGLFSGFERLEVEVPGTRNG